MSTIKKFLSDTVIYGVTTIVSRMIGFLMTPLYLRKFKDAAIYGIYSNFYAWMSMLNAILAFGMETTYFRYLQKVEPQDKNKVYNNSFFITLITSGLLLLSVFVFTRPIASWFADGGDVSLYEQYIKYFAFILVADALAVIPFTKLRAEGRPYKYSALKFVNIGITVISNLFFILFLPDWVHKYTFWADFAGTWFKEGWIGYVFISNLLASIVTLILLLPELLTFRFSLDRRLMNEMLKYSFPILVANISFIINENLDKMFFLKLVPGEAGKDDLGIYGAVAKLAVFLSLFVTAFRLGAEPFFFSYSKNQNASKTYALIMEYFVILMVIAMVGLTVNLDWLKYFIKGNEKEIATYWTGLKIVPILLFNYVLLGIYMNLSIWYKLTDHTRYAIYISGIGALITIMLNVWLIPIYSYVGAVLSTTVVYLVMIAFSLYWGQKYYPIPYKMIKISVYLGVGLLISWLSFQVFHSNIWLGNAMLLLLLGITFFLEKNGLMKLIRRK